MYFRARRSIPASAPSSVTFTTRPRIMSARNGSSGCVAESATRASRLMFLSLTRPAAELTTMRSPSVSAHTGETCGLPSAIRVARWT